MAPRGAVTQKAPWQAAMGLLSRCCDLDPWGSRPDSSYLDADLSRFVGFLGLGLPPVRPEAALVPFGP